MPLPNFLIIGAPKAGTTTLHEMLRQHPQVFVSTVKEPHYLAFPDRRLDFRGPGADLAMRHFLISEGGRYRRLFEGSEGNKAVGEASTGYLFLPEAADQIAERLPGVRLIAILRDPVQRAYSQYLHYRRDGMEPLSDFLEACENEPARIRDGWLPGWRYTSAGFYHRHLSRFYQRFEPEQVRVYLYEDLKNDPLGVVRSICRFLEVDPSFRPDLSLRMNVSGMPRHRRIHQFLRAPHPLKDMLKPLVPAERRRRWTNTLRRWNLNRAPSLPIEDRTQLIEWFREDVERLQDMLGRDLSHWLQPTGIVPIEAEQSPDLAHSANPTA